jgi:hypothetical protein
MPRIAAVVVSLPERHRLLIEALNSVYGQTRAPDDIVVGVDSRHYGEVENMNRLMDATDCEWVAFLHDDDIWLPHHLATAEKYMSPHADVIVSRFDMVNRPWSTMEPWHENFEDLLVTNWIGSPSMVVVRKSGWGRWVEPFGVFRWVDWANYNRVLADGAHFVDTKEVTTLYRFMGGNGSWSP